MFSQKLLFGALAFSLAVSACAPQSARLIPAESALPTAGFAAPDMAAPMPPMESLMARDVVGSPQTERLVIHNVSLALVVKDPAETTLTVNQLAQELGGFVVSANTFQTSSSAGQKATRATISLRVPANRLDEALNRLRALAVTVQSESRSGQDVTAQYTDLESQLKNLEAAEAQLQKIMQGAEKTEDVLNVYQQLVSVRGQIEQIKGQMKYYREAAALSLINLELIPDVLSQPIEVGGWTPEGVAREALEALIATLQGLVSLGIWLGIYVLPLLVLAALPVLALIWGVRRALNRKPKA